ncbi:hypothetical protein C8Q77DRAFT_727149 [Trametes polyzona]|nr:hypothetical protein C8Q77DRAFT_727149 [Trametes polyzona]
MTGRSTKTTKLVSAVRKRLGRELTRDEALRLAHALRRRQIQQQQQQRVYKPRMELWDDGESAKITALFELPGLGPDQVLLDVVDGRLIVAGERRPHLNPANKRAQAGTEAAPGSSEIRELKYGTFRREVAVPAGCTTEHLDATLEHGMLSVSWPRHPGHPSADEEVAQHTAHSEVTDTPDDLFASTRFGGNVASRSSY